jgi:hypothetical protein
MSLIEAIANVAVGFGLAVLTQMLVFPLFGLQASFADKVAVGSHGRGRKIRVRPDGRGGPVSFPFSPGAGAPPLIPARGLGNDGARLQYCLQYDII